MKLVEQKSFIVGYKKKTNDEWETSGKVFGNEWDAKWNAKQLSKHGDCITQVFMSNRFKPITYEYKYEGGDEA